MSLTQRQRVAGWFTDNAGSARQCADALRLPMSSVTDSIAYLRKRGYPQADNVLRGISGVNFDAMPDEPIRVAPPGIVEDAIRNMHELHRVWL